MKIICISDTHNKHSQLDIPEGNVIIHAGDFTEAGSKAETIKFLEWFSSLPHEHKIAVPGNHDFYIEKNLDNLESFVPANVHLLIDRGIEINDITFWGSPYTPGNGSWAFNKPPGSLMEEHWKKIPEKTTFLITHSPPYKILDELDNKENIGCEFLAKRIRKLEIPHHIFGHIHNDYGIITRGKTVYINASSLDNRYRHINTPLVWERELS